MTEFGDRRKGNRTKTLIDSGIVSVKRGMPRDGQEFHSPNPLLGNGRWEVGVQHLKRQNAEIVHYFDNAAET